MSNNSSYTDKFMIVDRLSEGNTVATFRDSYTGVANCIAKYNKNDLRKVKVLRSRNESLTTYRSIDLIPKFTIKFINGKHSYFYIQPMGHDPIPFPVPIEGDLCDAVISRDIEEVFTILLKDYSLMLMDLNLVHDLDPV